MDTHFIVHVPHASIEIPKPYRESILLNDAQLWRELCRMTDAFCHELFCYPELVPEERRIIAPVSRLVCDMERFRDDAMEPMSKRGQGLMYTRTTFGCRLRREDPALRDRVLMEYYDPHHERLTAAVDRALEENGRCMILDGHSFNSRIPNRWDCIFSKPDFDIGTDAYHTPPALRDALVDKVRSLGYTVRVNSPYGGAITPMKHYAKDKRVSSVMIEVNRRLYMDENTMQHSEGFEKTKEVCHQLMQIIASF